MFDILDACPWVSDNTALSESAFAISTICCCASESLRSGVSPGIIGSRITQIRSAAGRALNNRSNF